MNPKKWISRAPTRIDLAGGTVDIWPLYLLLHSPLTINLGIDLFAEAELDWTPEATASQTRGVTLRSEDQNFEQTWTWKELETSLQAPSDTVPAPPALELHFKLLRHFLATAKTRYSLEPSHLSLKTRARSPAGAGLGGSSTLSVAMIGAISAWASGTLPEPEKKGEKLIEITRDIETTVIRVPAGLQDYYGAMFGGLQSLRWGTGSHERKHMSPQLLPELEKRLLLFYSGQSRNSGINNWALFKALIDRDEAVRAKFNRIVEATRSLESALRQSNWNHAFEAIAQEWAARQTLAPGISTPEIDRAFAEAAKMGRITGKVCGAGGGGCFFVFLGDEQALAKKEAIAEIFARHEMRRLPFHASAKGLEVVAT